MQSTEACFKQKKTEMKRRRHLTADSGLIALVSCSSVCMRCSKEDKPDTDKKITM